MLFYLIICDTFYRLATQVHVSAAATKRWSTLTAANTLDKWRKTAGFVYQG